MSGSRRCGTARRRVTRSATVGLASAVMLVGLVGPAGADVTAARTKVVLALAEGRAVSPDGCTTIGYVLDALHEDLQDVTEVKLIQNEERSCGPDAGRRQLLGTAPATEFLVRGAGKRVHVVASIPLADTGTGAIAETVHVDVTWTATTRFEGGRILTHGKADGELLATNFNSA